MESFTTSVVTDRSDTHRACTNCSRAKAKCVVEAASSFVCQRCNRLNKLCEPAPVRAKAQPRKRKPLESTRIAKYRVEKLEEKLDDLVSLLKSGQENVNAVLISPPESTAAPLSNASVEHPIRQVQKPQFENSKTLEADHWDDRLHNGGTVFNRFGLPSDNAPLKSLMNKIEELPPYQLGDIDFATEDPDTLLNIFRAEMHSNFPFIVIPETQSASDLRQNRPTLFTAVMAVTTRYSAQQSKLGNQLVQQVAERVHVRGERNLDLLLGILTYAGWCYFHFYNVPRFTSLISSATTVVADMRLNSPGDQFLPNQFYCVSRNASGQEIPKEKQRTIEDRRSFLGYWYLTSTIAGFFRRLDRPNWTAYNEECCQVLETSNSHRHDVTAIRLIRIQLLNDKILQSPWHMKQETSGPVAPPILYLTAFQNELKDLKKRQSFEFEKNDAIMLSYQSTEALIHKTGLSKSPVLETFCSRDFNRIETLYACQQGIKQFFDIYLAVDAENYHCWSVPVFTLLAWNLGILQLLSTFHHPDWNLEWARSTTSFTVMLDLLSQKYSKAKAALGLDPHTTNGEDMFSNIVKKLQWIKTFYEGKFAVAAGTVQSDNVEPPNIEMPDFLQGAEYVDLLEDEWMQDLLGSWDY